MTVEALVDDLFRRSSAQLTAALVRVLGPERFDLAEEVVQDALVRALENWSYSGVPANPRGWLFQVARNRALDLLRRDANYEAKLAQQVIADLQPTPSDREDAELAMIFMCCDPVLPPDSQVALTLKSVGGFSVREIAAVYLTEESTIAQRLVRAKRLLAQHNIVFAIPSAEDRRRRIDVVLQVLYLMFTEGYAAHDSNDLLREELCGEAIRLARLLAADARTDSPAVHALLSLMLLQASRFRTRTDEMGNLLLLDQQDRSRWDRQLIGEGMRELQRCAAGDEITPFHVQAAIASIHASAPSSVETDWPAILRLYDQLLELTPTPIVRLHRAVAIAHVQGPRVALDDLAALEDHPAMKRYYLLPAVMGGLFLQLEQAADALVAYDRALALVGNGVERRFLEQRMIVARNRTQDAKNAKVAKRGAGDLA